VLDQVGSNVLVLHVGCPWESSAANQGQFGVGGEDGANDRGGEDEENDGGSASMPECVSKDVVSVWPGMSWTFLVFHHPDTHI
jgi:hypothetical protein